MDESMAREWHPVCVLRFGQGCLHGFDRWPGFQKQISFGNDSKKSKALKFVR
jgi:hypothetical protein